LLSLVARLRGERHVSLRGKTVPNETVNRAAGIVVGSVAVLGTAVFVMLVTELPTAVVDRVHFMRVVFEAHSAFGTVGLSMGPTATLSSLGRIGLCMLMFLGRVGPLTIAAAMAFRRQRSHLQYRYAHEEVVVG
jgi:trk/ktr system potassium uptake protein